MIDLSMLHRVACTRRYFATFGVTPATEYHGRRTYGDAAVSVVLFAINCSRRPFDRNNPVSYYQDMEGPANDA